MSVIIYHWNFSELYINCSTPHSSINATLQMCTYWPLHWRHILWQGLYLLPQDTRWLQSNRRGRIDTIQLAVHWGSRPVSGRSCLGKPTGQSKRFQNHVTYFHFLIIRIKFILSSLAEGKVLERIYCILYYIWEQIILMTSKCFTVVIIQTIMLWDVLPCN